MKNKYPAGKPLPEALLPYYSWLVDNLSPRIANLWLNERFDEFIKAIQEMEEL